VLRPDLFGAGRPRMRIDRAVDSPASIRAGLSVFGRHNAINAAAAAAVGWVMGCDAETIRQGLEAFRPVAMRSEMIPWEERMILNDAYNANPASMRAALDTLSRLPGGRRVAVLGDMRELGESEAQAHREVGEAAAACGIAYLIAMGSNAGRIAEGAVAGRMSPDRVAVCRDPEEAAKALRRETGPGDVILLKGSRGMKMERILEALGVRRGEGH
ncbi:MAG TPA: cyanophycin synthetase, partial [Nitrospiria bacterium]